MAYYPHFFPTDSNHIYTLFNINKEDLQKKKNILQSFTKGKKKNKTLDENLIVLQICK